MANSKQEQNVASLQQEYQEQGYAVARGLIPQSAVEHLLECYHRTILPSKRKFYRQNTSRYEQNQLNAHGYVMQSFLDIHSYASCPDFRDAALEIFFHDALRAMLSELAPAASHNLMQSMFFDLNTETPPHQDWWYVDSIPHGNLVAAWIALEEIHADAGRFYVMAGSNRLVFHEAGLLPHSEWLARMKRYVDEHPQELHAPALKSGDVLFWNSRTIHGSLPTTNERHSRKSLTCHYVPSHMRFGNLFISKDWVRYHDFRGNKHWANQPEYSLKHMMISKVKTTLYDHPVLVKLMRKFQRRGIADY